MNTKVTVKANKQGELITQSPRNPYWGWIRLVQTRDIINRETGIVKSLFCSALVKGKLRDLENLGWKIGQELEGKIIFRDSLTPYNQKNPEKDYKTAGKTGVICTVKGRPIYRRYFYTTNPNAVDRLIQHDEACKEEIRKAYNMSKKQADK